MSTTFSSFAATLRSSLEKPFALFVVGHVSA
jgi:hypothetical protein